MKLLVVGGTRFLGRAVVECAVSAGIDVTCFRRGTAEPEQQLGRVIYGDRTNTADVARLVAAGEWDLVVDTSSYFPEPTQMMAAALENTTCRYILISTVAVYRDWPGQPTTEASPVFDYSPRDHGEEPGYGARKAGCETAVQEAFGPERVAVLRPGAILGPHDYLGRLPWWLLRISQGGRVLAPGNPDRAITPVDVRDVAAFAIRAGEISGTYNVAGGPGRTMGDLLDACRTVTGSNAVLEWVSDEVWLAAQPEIQPWTSLPLWRADPGVWEVDSERARQAGLTERPLVDTVASTWQWLRGAGQNVVPNPENGITAAVERTLLERWDRLIAKPGPRGEAPAADSIE